MCTVKIDYSVVLGIQLQYNIPIIVEETHQPELIHGNYFDILLIEIDHITLLLLQQHLS